MSVIYVDFEKKSVIEESSIEDSTIIAYSSLSVANSFIQKQPPQLTPMKLTKLVYLAHGWCLALTGGHKLIDDPFCAWEFGVASPLIYKHFQHYRGSVIKTQHEDYSSLDGNCAKLVDVIIDRYGNWDQLSLSTLTSQEGTAWSRARIKGIGTRMSDQSIMSDFKKLLK